MGHAALQEQVTVTPQPGPQTQFAECSADVVFYGGSAGGGKSFGLILDPLYQMENPLFGAVIFRRTTKEIENEGGLWDEANKVYTPIGGKPNQNKLRFKFPSGMRVTFAHMEHEKTRFSYQGSQIPLIGFDEVTHFTWKQFIYMLSRNRSVSGVPARIRATCNPDPDSWVRMWIDWWIGPDGFVIKERSGVIRWFIVVDDHLVWGGSKAELYEKHPQRDDKGEYVVRPKSFTFIRSTIDDNQILLTEDPGYLANLHALTRVEKARLLDGNWNIRPTAGSYFKRSEFEIVDAVPAGAKRVRGWDLAGTDAKQKNAQDPDYTAGVRMAKVGGLYYIEHSERFRVDAGVVDKRILNMASLDGKTVKIRMPQDPGQAGKAQARQYTKLLAGYAIKTLPVTGSKEVRATPFSSQVQAGNVKIVRGQWNEDYLTELENFPEGGHDDQVDASSDAFDELTSVKKVGVW